MTRPSDPPASQRVTTPLQRQLALSHRPQSDQFLGSAQGFHFLLIQACNCIVVILDCID